MLSYFKDTTKTSGGITVQAIDAQIATVMTQTKSIANKLLEDLKQGKEKVTHGEK